MKKYVPVVSFPSKPLSETSILLIPTYGLNSMDPHLITMLVSSEIYYFKAGGGIVD
ncbi:hypothetical protein C1H46_030795 [Malus baccata]|uniref:Uncharacterized protein n=1 Tax=Malus baccata TaxID=106549 RepID=A0A540LAV9_MALBA|nr:hypothetical protein C1H46_030795 [Malus baccata]